MNNRNEINYRHASRTGIVAQAVLSMLAFCVCGCVARAEDKGSAQPAEQLSAAASVDALNEAIAHGDSAGARALLMPTVLIFESGEAETSADEYVSHHLSSDIQFMAGMNVERLSRRLGGDEKVSWVATRSRVRGHFKGKVVDLDSTETLVLMLTSAGWRIAHIHWSSSPHHSAATTR